MHEIETNKDGIYFLIIRLCRSLLQQHELPEQQIVATVPKLKSRAYEILLKKSTRPHVDTAESENEKFDPQRALDTLIFAAKLRARSKPELGVHLNEFEEQLEAIASESYFKEGTGRGVLQLLLALQGLVPDHNEMPEWSSPPLLVPGPFTLYANYIDNPHYPPFDEYNITQPAPRYFKGMTPVKSQENPYLPKFLFEGETNHLRRIEKKFPTDPLRLANGMDEECSFTGMTRRLLGNAMRINVQTLRLFPEPLASMQLLQKEEHKSKEEPQEEANEANDPDRVFSWNWESFGCFGVRRSKPFAGEANVPLLLQSYHDQLQNKEFEAKIVQLEAFLQDLKSLTVGIQTDIFKHDEYLVFSMEPNITIEGILPETMRGFVSDFLECGSCYKRLQTMISKRNYKLMFEGFIFKALCSAIDEYLVTFRQFVFGENDTHLVAFYTRLRKMIQQMIHLSYTLAIHPKVDANVKPPMGSQFLGYLYNEIMQLIDGNYIALLIFILRRCCHVYFKHLQKWIYYGLLDDPSNELFVGFVDHYRQNTKYFYDKAYFVRQESVPGFFQNFEDEILQCGKYTMLLKACKPNHPLFDLEYPPISVCLSFEEIEQLKSTCERYFQRAREVGVEPLTIRQVFETRAEEKRQFFQRMVERSRANLERWTDEQHELAIMVAEQKKKRLEELTTQLQDAKQRKIDERRANVELELKFLREAEKLEEQRMLRENINLRKRIEYYQELSEMMSERDGGPVKDVRHRLTVQIPSVPTGAQRTQPPPQTPASTAGTDFESCFGDEDERGSEYEECISEDFVQKFAENEHNLKELCAKGQEDREGDTKREAVGQGEEENANISKTALKRSASDVINSNELPSLVLTVLERNRHKAMSGSSVEECFKNLQITTKATELVDGGGGGVGDAGGPGGQTQKLSPLTEAQRNKLKILTEEFGVFREEESLTKSMPDINLNTLPESELTDLQRNRRRMMHNDPFVELNKDPWSSRTQLHLNLDTERARNRQKVLESEFNILTGHAVNTDPVTPMSTTSDMTSPLTEVAAEGRQTDPTLADVANANVGRQPESALKLDINLASDHSSAALPDTTPDGVYYTAHIMPPEQDFHFPNSESVAAKETDLRLDVSRAKVAGSEQLPASTTDTLDGTTPECGLNTAGLMAKQGFAFPNADQLKTQQQQQAATIEKPKEGEPSFPEPDYSDPYKRCVQLIESNFKCDTANPFMRLNTDKTATTAASILIESSATPQTVGINSLSVITLTDFLQKSVVIPMRTHLQLVNNEVMRMFLQDLHLLDHLRSLRNYFLLMDGEFGSIICDGLIGKLEDGFTPDKLLNYQMLHSILDTALGSSITGSDKNAENLSFIVSDVPAEFDLSSPDVLDNLSLSYRIDWPLNLILNPETLDQYANIFKYLIRVRRISWILEQAYQLLKEAVKQNGKAILRSPQYRHVQLIRHKFYHFVHVLQNHITANALQASWKTFKDELLDAHSIEDIYRKHTTYIKRILFLCMLNKRSSEFHNTIENVFKISLRFYNDLKSRSFRIRAGDENFTHSRYEKLCTDEADLDKLIKFTIYLGNKIVRHGYQSEIGEFISLINYNQYYVENAQ